MPEVMRCVLLCMLEAVEGGLCLLDVKRCTMPLSRLEVAGATFWSLTMRCRFITLVSTNFRSPLRAHTSSGTHATPSTHVN